MHELVHARLAQEGVELPLWFEEGVATFLGDGALVSGRWVVDGLACWPLRELQKARPRGAELRRLLARDTQQRAISAQHAFSVRLRRERAPKIQHQLPQLAPLLLAQLSAQDPAAQGLLQCSTEDQAGGSPSIN